MVGLISKNKPYFTFSDLIAILKFWDLGSIERFEKQFAEFAHARYAVSFPYARSAIWALVSIWNENPTRNEVIMSAYTCTVVAHPVMKAGCRPCFADIDLETYNPRLDEIVSAVGEKTRAIIPVHTYGIVMDVGGLVSRLPRKDILIIEDAALCPKQIYKNPEYPNTATIYSLGHTKHFSSVEGGIAATDNEMIYRKLLAFRNTHFIKPSFGVHVKNILHFFIRYFLFSPAGYWFLDLLRGIPALKNFYDERSMDDAELPSDYNRLFSAWQGRLALSQLKKSDVILKKRKQLAKLYWDALCNFSPEVIPCPFSENIYWSHYPVRILDRDTKRIREQLRERGIEAGVTFDYSLPELPVFKQYVDRDFPVSRKAAGEMINVPNYPSFSERKARYIAETLKNIIRGKIR